MHRLNAILSVLIPALLAACSTPPPDPGVDDTTLLTEVVEDHWRDTLEDEIWLRIEFGEPIGHLPDVSEAGAQRSAERARRHLDRLAAIRSENLEYSDWLTYEMLRWDLERIAEAAEHFWLIPAITPRQVRSTNMPALFEDWSFAEPTDLDGYLDLLRQYPTYAEAVIAKTRGQAERGIRLPRAEIDLVLPMWRTYQGKGEESPFFVATDRLEALPKADAVAFQAEVRERVDGRIAALLEELTTYLDGEYRAAAPEALGYGQYPGGDAYYRYIARYWTTVDLSPEEVHQAGLRAVDEILTEMDEVRATTDFTGSRPEFHDYIREDPRFHARSPEALQGQFESFVALIEPRLPEYFPRLPQAPYAIERLRPELEASVTYGFFRPATTADPRGIYFFNGGKLDQQSVIRNQGMIYHELLPGHHLQVTLQRENEELPTYRRAAFYSSYAEGWAVYAGELGREMGLYQDPYNLYGHLGASLQFAVRLVLDTGLNAFDWSQERAERYMAAHSINSPSQIRSEILRYGVGAPGQALAYRIGRDKIWELRRRAEDALGQRFDLRRFHGAVLDPGPLPLAVLEKHIDRFIERELEL